MLQVIAKIPLFVWPLLTILIFAGLRARKATIMPLAVLLLIPSIFFILSLFTFFGRYAGDLLAMLLWILCLASGFFFGFSHVKRLRLQFDKQKKRVELPGSWMQLILSLSIFSSKISVMMMNAEPHLKGSILILVLELFSTIILGIFAGRGIGCLIRYRSFSAEVVSAD